jgi:hypothetical protein
MITTQALIESLEWLLKRANGSHVAIDIYTLRKVLDALKAAAAVLLLLVGTADAKPHKPTKPHAAKVVRSAQLPGQKLRTRATHRNPDPFGRSGLDQHTFDLRGL